MQRIRRGVADRGFGLVERLLGIDAERHIRAARQRILRQQRAIELESVGIGIGIDDAREAHGVVVGQQFFEPPKAVCVGWVSAV